MLSQKSYILSLGAGKNQLPFLEAIKILGYKIIAIDKDSKAIGFSLADLKIIESITEYRKIYSILVHTFLDAPIVAIGCRSYGKARIAAAYLAEKLKVIDSSLETIKKFYNKYYLKKILSENKVPIPLQVLFNKNQKNIQNLSLNYPIVAKPVKGFSKKGIQLIQNKKELLSFSSLWEEEYVLEEYIDGKEFTVLGFVQNGVFHLVSVSEKITTSTAPFLELAHILPSSQPELIGEIRLHCQRIASIMKLNNSPLVAEFKSNSKKNLFLIEVVPEIGGEYLADWLVLKHYNYNFFEDYVRLITGEKLKLYNKEKISKQETWIRYLACPPGKYILKDYLPIQTNEKLDVFFDRIFYMPESVVDSSMGNNSRLRVFGFQKKINPYKEKFIPNKTYHWEAQLEPIN